MNEKFNKNTKVEQLTKVVLSHGEEKGLIVKDPLGVANTTQTMKEKMEVLRGTYQESWNFKYVYWYL